MATVTISSWVIAGSFSTSRNLVSARHSEGTRCFFRDDCGLTKRNNSRGIVTRSRGPKNASHRHGSVMARSADQLTATETGDKARQRESLKKKLTEQILAASGNLTDECIATINELEKFNPNPESLNDWELHAGYWEQVKGTFVGTGRKGEGKVEVGYQGASATLGRATFNTLGHIGPGDLNIVMGEVYSYVPKAGVDGEEKYAIVIEFTTKNPKGDDLPPVEGLITNGATMKIDSPSRMGILFDETRLRPLYPERDLQAWKEIFEETSSPAMNEMGEIIVSIEKPRPGHLDVIYIDDEFRIIRGNFGNYVVVKRMHQPPRFVR